MTNEIWLNLAVSDVSKTTTFFKKLGFSVNDHAPNSETMVSFAIGAKKFIINFFRNDVLGNFTAQPTEPGKITTNVMISIDAENEKEVDEMLKKAEAAGGKISAKGGYVDGWMYGGGFIDLDGHQWNLLYMNMAKMPKE